MPAQYSQDAGTCVDPFRIMSAVWLTRWNGGYPLSRVHTNPNAMSLLPQQDEADLAAAGMSRASRP